MWLLKFACLCLHDHMSIGNVMEFTPTAEQQMDRSKQDPGSLGNRDEGLKYDIGREAHDFSCIYSKGTQQIHRLMGGENSDVLQQWQILCEAM